MRFLIFTLLLTYLFICNSAFAQLDKYPTYDAYLNYMNKFREDYPELCKVVEFGTSVQNRKLLAVKISDNVGEDEAEPDVFYLSTIHGDETGGYVILLQLIDHLLSNYGKDTFVTKLVDSVEIWINPLANPDGTYAGGNDSIGGAVRRNANNVDLDNNFPCPDGTNPGVIQKETQAIIDFCSENNFVLSADFHAGAEMIVYPWGYTSKNVADKEWFEYVCKNWADSAQEYSPSGYFTQHEGYANYWEANGAITPPKGTFIDYMIFYQHCRDVKVEISYQKMLPESQLIDHWNYQKQSLLYYIDQSLYGIRGTVTCLLTGEPVDARIHVLNHDMDSSQVYSHLPHGDYYRPIYVGTYDVNYWWFNDYYQKTIDNIVVNNNRATVADVQLDETGVSNSNKNSTDDIQLNVCNNKLKIFFFKHYNKMEIEIFCLSGKLVKALDTKTGIRNQTIVWNGLDNNGKTVSTGCYIVRLENKQNIIARRFIFSR